jgi:hypothetical protein
MEATGDYGGAPNLAPDQATIQAGNRANAVALIGYVGVYDANPDEYIVLYRDLTLNQWLQIRTADVIDRVAADGSNDVTSGESIVWVQPDAEISSGGSGPVSGFEEFGTGPPGQYKWPRR